jgi:hypothetical protein
LDTACVFRVSPNPNARVPSPKFEWAILTAKTISYPHKKINALSVETSSCEGTIAFDLNTESAYPQSPPDRVIPIALPHLIARATDALRTGGKQHPHSRTTATNGCRICAVPRV